MSAGKLVAYISSDDVARELLAFCKNGKTVNQIISHLRDYYRTKKGISNEETVRGYVAARLNSLETRKVLEFRNSYWYTSDQAKTILEKYFGR